MLSLLGEICCALETPPMVRDLSQTQKALMCPTSPLAYFGIVRFAICDIGKRMNNIHSILC